MKTPMQELIETIKKLQKDDDVQPFMWHEQIIKLAESMLEKEKSDGVCLARWYQCLRKRKR